MAPDRQLAGARGGGDRHPNVRDEDLMKRRAIAAGVGIVVLIVLILLIKGCAADRNERSIRDYVNNVSALAAASQESMDSFFEILENPGDAGVTDIQTRINSQRTQAQDHIERAKQLDTPGELSTANRYFVDALELRRDGLAAIASQIAPALGDQDAEEAVRRIAAEMQNFLASDVIYLQRTYPAIQKVLRDRKIGGEKLPTTVSLKSLDWLDPTKVEDVIGRARGASSSKTVAPGTHGTGVTEVKALPSGTTVQDGGTLNLSGAQSIEIQIQNQGENDETNVVVNVKIGDSGITLKDTIAAIKQGETQTASLPLTKTPAGGGSAEVSIQVKGVPGEKNLDNNKFSFSASFGS